MNDPLTDEDAKTIILAARLSGRDVPFVAQTFFMELPQEHSALHSYAARCSFRLKLEAAEKQYDEETKATHS